MTGHGDIEAVNFGTGERHRRVTGKGGSFLESLGIPGLKPVDPADLAEYEQAMREDPPCSGGLIAPPLPGCAHEWESHPLSHALGSTVKKCRICHVLGCPPKE